MLPWYFCPAAAIAVWFYAYRYRKYTSYPGRTTLQQQLEMWFSIVRNFLKCFEKNVLSFSFVQGRQKNLKSRNFLKNHISEIYFDNITIDHYFFLELFFTISDWYATACIWPHPIKGAFGSDGQKQGYWYFKIKHFVNFHLVPIFLKLYVSLEKQNLVYCIVDKV